MLGLVLALFLVHKPPEVPWPGQMEQATQVGCDATEYSGAQPRDKWWHTYLWIDLPSGRWRHRISIRPGNERAKALKDCDQFLHLYQNEVTKRRKPHR